MPGALDHRASGVALRHAIAAMALEACVSIGLGFSKARPRGRQVGGISVDVGPLLAQGCGGFAEILRADLVRALQAEFAGRLGPGQRLVATVRGLSLNSYAVVNDT